MNPLWTFLGTMPSTNVRMAATILMMLATGLRVVALGWNPPLEWLGFLTAWAGLDIAQFAAKRVTQNQPPPLPPPAAPEIGS